MKKLIFSIFTILSTFNLFAQNGFEGKIVMRCENSVSNEVSDITWYMKNGQHLLNYVNSGSKMNGTYSLLSKEGKTEMINERGRINIPGNSLKQADFDFSAYKMLNKEGDKVINEFSCIKYTIEQGDKIAEYWIADDPELHTSDFPQFMNEGLIAISEKLHTGGIPIQIKISDRNRKMLYQQTISYIMPCKVGDEKFK